MKSKTKIGKQVKRKTNSELVKTIIDAKKHKSWVEIAGMISGPRRKRINLNLDKINKEAREGETLVIPGKVLSQGEIKKKVKIVALGFSENAMEKLSTEKVAFSTIDEEIKKNPEAKGIRILIK